MNQGHDIWNLYSNDRKIIISISISIYLSIYIYKEGMREYKWLSKWNKILRIGNFKWKVYKYCLYYFGDILQG